MQPANAERGETSLRYPGWRVVVLCFVMALLCWGLGFYGHGFYLAELKRQHGWSTTLISSASTACYLVSAVLVIFISDAIRRFGVRGCVVTGSIAFAAAAAALPFLAEPWQLFVVYLVMALGWATMSVGAITNILGLWFEQKRGLAISLALNGASFSGVIVVPFLVLITERRGFASAMLVSALIIVGLIVPLLALIPGGGRPHATPIIAASAADRLDRPRRGPRRSAGGSACPSPHRSPATWDLPGH